MVEAKRNNRLNKRQKQKYDTLVSYLNHIHDSNSDLLVLRPGEKLRTIEWKIYSCCWINFLRNQFPKSL